jgi:putative acetyltransferase
MSPPRTIRLRDDRPATVRKVSVDDAAGIVAVERGIAADGRGMVVTPEQVRTVEAERAKIEELYRNLPRGGASLMAVAVDEQGTVLGSGELRQLGPTRCQHVGIFSLGVALGAQRLGVGRAIMEYLIDHARAHGLIRIELYTRDDNMRGRALYESLGFVLEGVRRKFVRLEDGTFVDDLTMVRFLTP